MVSAGVNSVPEHSYGREVVSDARVVLNVVEPSCHIHILLLLLDGQVHYEWMDSKVHESISYGELVASQVDLILQVEVEVLQDGLDVVLCAAVQLSDSVLQPLLHHSPALCRVTQQLWALGLFHKVTGNGYQPHQWWTIIIL